MITATASAPLVSLFAQFVQGDIKGGAHAHAFRTNTIRSAIEQLFKGNYSPIAEAATLTTGKAKKARAYAAAFATFGVVGTDTVKVDYVGKLDSAANKEIRAVIDQKTHAATAAFFVAFDAVMAEKAEPKAKAPTAPVAEPTPAAAPAAPDADAERHSVAVQADDAVSTMVAMISNGMLTGAQLDALSDAVNARILEEARAAAAVLAALQATELEAA